MVKPAVSRTAMSKFMFSLGHESYQLLKDEAKTRDITVQQLLRAVIIPDWVRSNLRRTLDTAKSSFPQRPSFLTSQEHTLQPSIARIRP